MTERLNEYKQITGEELLRRALADDSVKSLNEMTPEEQQQWLNNIEESGVRIRTLLNNINSGK